MITLFLFLYQLTKSLLYYSDMVLRHDKICCTTDKSPFKKELLESISDIEDIKGPVVSDFIRTLVEPIEDVCNERATVLKTGMKVKLLVLLTS